MDAKYRPLCEDWEKESISASNSPPRKHGFNSRAFVKLLVAGSVLSLVTYKSIGDYLHQTCHGQGHQPHALVYEGEHIKWTACGDSYGHPLECSSIHVPMDQFDENRSTNKNFSIPLIRLRGGQNATQNLLVNPGGPGGSGVAFLAGRGKMLRDIVGDGFHLLSFDPRGINGSRPLALCYPSQRIRQWRSFGREAKLVEDSPEMYAWSQNYVQACRDTMDERGAYINTPQTAADMNSILDAVGQKDMVYWGFSYGTILGQTYATLFPDRSYRVIIDGVANNFDWYNNRFDSEEFHDSENVLDGLLDECVKAGPKNCTLASVASTKSSLSKKLYSFAEQLQRQPMSVYINSTVYGTLSYQDLWSNGIFTALYKPASWPKLTRLLTDLLEHNNATSTFLEYGLEKTFKIIGDAFEFVSLNDGASGPAFWKNQSREMLVVEMLQHVNKSGSFAVSSNDYYYAKQAWAIPRSHSFVPVKGVRTKNPLLILSTTYDPVCPLISARSARDAFVDSRIIEVKGYGHCSIAVPSLCMAKRIRTFLYEGVLPKEEDIKCEVDAPYFPIEEEEKAAILAMGAVEVVDEETKIRRAQMELAKEWEYFW